MGILFIVSDKEIFERNIVSDDSQRNTDKLKNITTPI